MDVAKLVLAIFFIIWLLASLLFVLMINITSKKEHKRFLITFTKMVNESIDMINTKEFYMGFSSCSSSIELYNPLKKEIEKVEVTDNNINCLPKESTVKEETVKDLYCPDKKCTVIIKEKERWKIKNGIIKVIVECDTEKAAKVLVYNKGGWTIKLIPVCRVTRKFEGELESGECPENEEAEVRAP